MKQKKQIYIVEKIAFALFVVKKILVATSYPIHEIKITIFGDCKNEAHIVFLQNKK